MSPPSVEPIVPIPPAATLSYEQSYNLMNDSGFMGRIQVACLTYASYIAGEPAGTVAHNTRYRWAQATFLNPRAAAITVQPSVVMEEPVQTQGSGISDQDLQLSTETAVNQML
jgi:hypothetical protein